MDDVLVACLVHVNVLSCYTWLEMSHTHTADCAPLPPSADTPYIISIAEQQKAQLELTADGLGLRAQFT